MCVVNYNLGVKSLMLKNEISWEKYLLKDFEILRRFLKYLFWVYMLDYYINKI